MGYMRAAEIRDFDPNTIESLGRQSYENRHQNPKSLRNAEARALRVTQNALKGKIDSSYQFVVLRDPNAKGYLVYALVTSENPTDVLLGGYFRVSISANGEKVQKVDAFV